MFCVNCGAELKEGTQFCVNCGFKQTPNKEAAPDLPETEQVAAAASAEPAAPVYEAVTEPAAEPLFETAAVEVPPVEPVHEPAPIPEPVPAAPVYTAQTDTYIPPVIETTDPKADKKAAKQAKKTAAREKAAASGAGKPVSAGLYVLLLILGAIPVIGLIVNLIVMAAAKNYSLKNFAKAVVILSLILLIILLIAAIVGYIFLDEIKEFVFTHDFKFAGLIISIIEA